MSTTIDQRVVEMKFDNQQFEKGVSTTTTSLDKLKKGLDFTGASKGLGTLNSSIKEVDTNGLNEGVNKVQASFSALQVIGVTALANITTAVMRTGTQMIKSLTLEPVMSGFREYETQINSIQTILANTQGENTTLNQVNKALDELNLYADKTIYNFTEMTRNIGTFTAAGVKLDDSVAAIKGIANLAALSGSNAQQASGAMYQLSQALAAGRVTLMDWNSVVNAGMGGKVFQDALMQTAETMGIAVDRSVSFRESISAANGNETWLTDEVLINTLQQFTGDLTDAELAAIGFTEAQIDAIQAQAKLANDAATKVKTFTQLMDTLKEAAQSGWSQTWRLIIGDFEQARDLYTQISDIIGGVIGAASDARNATLADGLTSSWEKFLALGVVEEDAYVARIKTVAKEQGVAIDDMIDNGESFRTSLKKLTKDGVLTTDLLKDSLDRLTKEYSEYTDEELESMDITKKQVKEMKKLNKEVQNGTVDIQEYVDLMDKNSGRDNLVASLLNTFKAIGSIAQPILDAFNKTFGSISGDQIFKFTEDLRKFTKSLILTETESENLKSTFKGLFSIFNVVWTVIKKLASAFVPLVGSGRSLISALLTISGLIGEFVYAINSAIIDSKLFNSLFKTISKTLSNLGEVFTTLFKSMAGLTDSTKAFRKAFNKTMDEIAKHIGDATIVDVFEAMWNGVAELVTRLADIGANLFTGLGDALSSDDFIPKILDAINTGLIGLVAGNISRFFKQIGDVAKGFNEVMDSVATTLAAFQTSVKANALRTIAISIAILAGSLWLISSLDTKSLTTALTGVAALFGQLIIAMNLFTKISGISTGIFKSSALLLVVSSSILILSVALKILSTMEWGELFRGMVGLTSVTTALLIMFKVLSANKKAVVIGAKQLRTMSISILIMAATLKILGSISVDELVRGVGGLVAIVTALMLIFKILSANKKAVVVGSKQLLTVTISLTVLAGAMKILASITYEELGRAALGLLGAVITLTTLFLVLSKSKKFLVTGATQMTIISTSLVILASGLKILATLKWGDIARSMVALGTSLVILAFGLRMMTGTIAGAVGLLVAANAILILAPALLLLSKISWSGILKSLALLAGVFIVLGIAVAFLSPLVPAIVALSVSIAMFGLSILAVSAGVTLLAIGLTALSAAFIAVGTAGISTAVAFVTVIRTVLEGLLTLLPKLATALAESLVSFVVSLADGAGTIAKAITKLFKTIIPALVESFAILITTFIEAIAEFTPRIAAALLKFILGILKALAKYMPEIVTTVFELFASFWTAILDSLKKIKPESLIDAVLGIGLLTAFLIALGFIAGLIPAAMAGVLGLGILMLELGLVLAILGGIAQIPGLTWLIEEGGELLGAIGSAIGQLIGGFIGGIGKGITSQLPAMANDLSLFMTNLKPFIEGAQGLDSNAMKGVTSLALAILALTAADVLNGLASWLTGGSSLSKFGDDLAKIGPSIRKFADEMVGVDGKSLQASAKAIFTLAKMAGEVPNSGGAVALFTGENSLTDFVEELVTIAPKLKQYSDSVQGVDASSIKRSAKAVTALAEMSHELPNEGGAVAIFTGDNSLSVFADHLITLGPKLKAYSLSVEGMNTDAIIASTRAIKGIIAMSADIENEGGFVSLFTGDNTLSDFAEHLIKFGNRTKEYSDVVSGVNIEAVSAVTKEMKKIVNIFDEIGDVASGVVSFSSALNSIGKQGLQSLVDGFTGAAEATEKIIITTITTIINSIITALSNLGGTFRKVGTELMTKFANGYLAGTKTVTKAVKSTISTIVSSIKTKANYNKFYNTGAYFVSGFRKGIVENQQSAVLAAINMANAAHTAAKKELQEKSPSKVGFDIGAYFGVGFVNGIVSLYDKVTTTGATMASKARIGLETALDAVSGINSDKLNPTIKPVLDLSDVEKGFGSLDSMMSRDSAISISNGVNAANGQTADGVTTSENSTTVNYYQNNYSPKALSRYDIYRQTKNQLALAKEGV